ncbi:MAG TPA: hypothetical protein V6D17_00500 [Candidatus Obscuribacterales bacterium]
MTQFEKSATAKKQSGAFVERRRMRLPQPDFAPYIKANAYPGPAYFFVGHSFNVDESLSSNDRFQAERAEAIKSFFNESTQWVSVRTALANERFVSVLSRFEFDLLSRLPESALVGPAFDRFGKLIFESFTIWRKEMRKQAS